MQHGNFLGIKRRMVAGAEAAGVLGELEAVLLAESLDERIEFLSRARAINGQLVVVQAADHIEIEHGDCVFERISRLTSVVCAAVEAFFLSCEGDKHNSSP